MEMLLPFSLKSEDSKAAEDESVTVLVNRKIPRTEEKRFTSTLRVLLLDLDRFPGASGNMVFRREIGADLEFSILQRFAKGGLANGEQIAFGAIWEGETVATITTVPNKEASAVHDRMPVILREDQYERWFSPGPLSEGERRSFLGPLPDGSLLTYPVDGRVGSVRHNDLGLIDPLAH